MKAKVLKVDYLARVEGEGGLYVKIRNNSVSEVKLNIFEPPRFFEAFLRGRRFDEAPDITARICGICPVAYQMSAVHAMEDAFGIKVAGQLRSLRRLIYCGEWIESHALHVYMLHAPDFLGFPDAIQMARDHADVVQRGLRLKKAGNEIVRLVGGREIHPINVRVGGFYKVPTQRELAPLAEQLKWARDAALETVRWVARLPFPEFTQDYLFVPLRHPEEYPFNEGRLVSNRGLDIAIADYDSYFLEEHVQHSNALHSTLKNAGAYFVGPLARYSLNFDRLPPSVPSGAAAPLKRRWRSGSTAPSTRLDRRTANPPVPRRSSSVKRRTVRDKWPLFPNDRRRHGIRARDIPNEQHEDRNRVRHRNQRCRQPQGMADH